jgi:preprotein translocase subunit SecG
MTIALYTLFIVAIIAVAVVISAKNDFESDY